ncbi:methyltransferase family protein [Lactobacillus selangorensis]|uniref:Methyltransferase family protein n=1 Tax=Lactobacillus selangorensis TaxID=81857 RepID=A0A0R2FU63_9LACO|nr:methyltransferase domain-containing protein [Lactobacillus selangorensis]KRN28454.1 methyltransferase family protein [Lactobacillus selangorensis]KRN31955.1 methyltransferase family protein [Lactobacillus selangorensis]
MKKIIAAQQFLQNHLDLFECPLCHEPFVAVNELGIVCPQGHRFDLSRKGTLYFLKKHVKTEYDAQMLAHRRNIIQAGFFDPFLQAIAASLQPATNILDVGCGEGSTTSRLAQQVPAHYVGFDISKPGINLATQQPTNVFFCVADLANLPFNHDSFDTLLDIFSPSQYAEFDRVLKPGGQLLKIVPNLDYLHELRTRLYAGQAKENYQNNRVVDLFAQHVRIRQQQRIRYIFDLNATTFEDLLAMTPLTWQAAPDKLAALRADPLQQITIDVTLLRGEKPLSKGVNSSPSN